MANKALTIYISADVIRIAEMQKNNKTAVVLSNAAEITTPSGAFNDGYIIDNIHCGSHQNGNLRQRLHGEGSYLHHSK